MLFTWGSFYGIKKAATFHSAGFPPAIMFQGTADDTVPPWTAEAFAKRMRAAGNRCDLHMYEGQTHLNWGENAADVLQKMDAFLRSLGFMKNPN
jgi:acetyl esterase